ncbi:MAG: lipoprotein [Pseudomonadota bacterium]
MPALALLLAALSSLTACGQKGPLYLPKKPAAVTTNTPATSIPATPVNASEPEKKE